MLCMGIKSYAQSTDYSCLYFLDYCSYTLATFTPGSFEPDTRVWDEHKRTTGILSMQCAIGSYKCKEQLAIPDNPNIEAYVITADNDTVSAQGLSLVGILKLAHMSKVSAKLFQFDYELSRPGRYKTVFYCPMTGFKHEETNDWTEGPSLRCRTKEKYNIGKPVQITGYISTGYPYNQEDISGDEWAKYTLYSVDDDDNRTEITSETKNIGKAMKNNEKSFMAGMDSITTNFEGLDFGHYILKMESNWHDLAYEYKFQVVDTVSTKVQQDKEVYDLSKDKEAKIDVEIGYGYPYVPKAAEGQKPSVNTIVSIVKPIDDLSAFYPLTQDSISFEDEKFCQEKFSLQHQFTLDLTKLDIDEVIANADKLGLIVAVEFNGKIFHYTHQPIKLTVSSTGIKQTSADKKNDDAYYSLDGRIISQPKQKGVYIKNGKKYIVR